MDKATKERIFEPFFTTKSHGKGTGLGLSTVYSIIKQNSGYILVSSEPHHGTTFSIYFPSCKDMETLPESKTSPHKLPQGSETILLVEDEDTVRTLTHSILEERGYTVVEAKNGNEALMICKEHSGNFHLMITDIIMPGMNGNKLVQEVTRLYPNIKILYISGYSDDIVVQYGISSKKGQPHFLKKPLTPSMLLCKVREVIDLSS
jgi:CheY-like chemotaxis protein